MGISISLIELPVVFLIMQIFGLYGVVLFAYQTLDALDGLQGRKVGMYTNATTEGT
jgi:phosphatidylglycerophosphate synthase